METISKLNFEYDIKVEDSEYVNNYLEKVEKRSHGSFKNNKWIIEDCLNFIKKDIKTITTIDIKKYFDKVIDNKINARTSKLISFDTKEAYRSYLKSFFNYIKKRYLEKNLNYYNPVPENDVYEFDQAENDIKKQSEIEEDIFTDEELLELLETAKIRKLRDFIIFSLLIIDGPRISEILTIKLRNINLNLRYYDTGFLKDARKTSMNTKKSLLFFFPENFRPYLEQYFNGKDFFTLKLKNSFA